VTVGVDGWNHQRKEPASREPVARLARPRTQTRAGSNYSAWRGVGLAGRELSEFYKCGTTVPARDLYRGTDVSVRCLVRSGVSSDGSSSSCVCRVSIRAAN
jgi:hypothetical protein